MPAYKDKETGKWMSRFYYETYQGERKQKKKRGFNTKKEALAFERKFMNSINGSTDMDFSSLVELYANDCANRLRDTTLDRKKHIFARWITPYFKDRPINEIEAKDIRHWQNWLMKQKTQRYDKPLSKTYLKGVNNELSAIFNFACNIYGLNKNPVRQSGSIGKKNREEVTFWTLDEFNTVMSYFDQNDPHDYMYYFIYNLLFYTGMRSGELLALNKTDFNYKDKTIRINKTYIVINKTKTIREPKTENAKRLITAPDFIFDMLDKYLKSLYSYKSTERLFDADRSMLKKRLDTATKNTHQKHIRVHDLRHSHASYLIHLGIDPLSIKERLGHKSIETTLNIYSHLYPNRQAEIATLLNKPKLSPEFKNHS